MASASLVVRVSAQIAEFQKSFDDAAKTANKFAGEFEGIATRAAAVGAFIGNVAADIARSMARALGQAFSDAIRLSSEFSNAFIGLSSVARAFGTDADLAKAAAQRLSSDGLLPLKDSATGLKNLLAAGFNLDQATQLMNAFKDSAAFGRQSALSFGDAIRSATEGVKNGNSILVDNAGVTKNLSQILKEAGFSAQDLSRASTDAAVRMALFNGIMRETVAQTGDAERLTQTYSGQVSKLSTAYDTLLANLGMAITQNATVARAIGLVSDLVFRLTQHLSNNRNAFNLVSDAVIIFVKALSGTVQVVDVVQRAFNAFVIVINTFIGDMVAAARAVFKVVEKVEELQKWLDPVNFKRHAAAADEARVAYGFLDRVAGTLARSTQQAVEQGTAWGATLQSLKGRLDSVAKELETTRGKTVELGVAALGTARGLGTDLDAGSKKAADALKKLQNVMDDTTSSLKNGLQTMVGLKVDMSKFLEFLPPKPPDFAASIRQGLDGLSKLPGTKVDLSNFIPELKEGLFGTEFGQQLGRVLGDAFRSGSVINAVSGGASLIGSTLLGGLAKHLTTGANAITGWLGGMISSALPVIGSLMGPLVEKIAGFFDGIFGNKGRDLVKDFAASFGGFDSLQRKLAETFDPATANRFWVALTQGVGRNNPEQAKKIIDEIAAAFAGVAIGIGTAIDAINAKSAAFASPFQKLLTNTDVADFNAKLAAMGQKGQAEFERIGLFAAAAFAGFVKNTGDAIGAIQKLGATFQVLQDGVTKFGLTSTGTIDALISMFALVTDTVTGPILQAIQTTGQIFAGLQQGGLLTSELFQTVAADIGASFRDLEAKGGDVAKAMALSQPVLQKLWEAQQIYGEITDETTAKLLRQAEEQGIVGAHMKDVNQKILDVLIAIADVFGAKIPDGMRATQQAATNTAATIQREFGNIKIPKIWVDVEFNVGKLPNPSLTPFASGGVVTRPTLALIGEAGPEAVIPLNQLRSVAPQAGTSTHIWEVGGRVLAEVTVEHIPGVVRHHLRPR